MRNLLWTITLFFGLMLLAACGGSAADEPAASNDEPAVVTQEETVTEEDVPVEEPMEEPTEAPVEEPAAAAEEPAAEESMVEPTEAPAEEAAPAGFGDLPMSGTDPDTGLEINPDVVNPGDTFIARGIVISMNLTPVTEPEFLIQAPSGTKYRMRTQALADMYFDDGSQWQAYEFRQGVGATATVTLDASAGLSDVSTTQDLVLIMVEK